jgi:hypothetical protein
MKTGADIIRECGDDAARWADAFMEMQKSGRVDHETMIGWFANAIESRPRPRLQLTGSEAAYGLIAWLTTRRATVTLGSAHDCGELPTLIDMFVKANELEAPRDRYSNWLRHPVEKAKCESVSTSRVRCSKDADHGGLHSGVLVSACTTLVEWGTVTMPAVPGLVEIEHTINSANTIVTTLSDKCSSTSGADMRCSKIAGHDPPHAGTFVSPSGVINTEWVDVDGKPVIK